MYISVIKRYAQVSKFSCKPAFAVFLSFCGRNNVPKLSWNLAKSLSWNFSLGSGTPVIWIPSGLYAYGLLCMWVKCNHIWTYIWCRGPFVSALDKTWCPDHFVCANPNCRVPLVNCGFVEEAGQLFCEKDYEQYFAPRCGKCGRAIIGVSWTIFWFVAKCLIKDCWKLV